MPIRKVKGGYKWGKSGKVYPTKAGAQKQAQAAYASGYKGYKNGGPVAGQRGRMGGIGNFLSTVAGMMPGFPVNIGNATIKVGGIPGQAIHGIINSKRGGRKTGTGVPSKRGDYTLSGYNWSPSRGANLSGSDNTRFSGIMNVGGKGSGKGAGSGYGQMQRAKRKETRRMQKMMKDVAKMIDPQTYIDQGFSEEAAQKLAGAYRELYGTPNMVREYFFSQNKGPFSVYGTMDELRAAGVDARPSMATSFGMPKNWEEIYKYFEETGSFEGAPPPRAVYDESTLSSLGIRSLPPQIAQNTKPYWWPDSLPWPGDGDG